MTKWIAALCVSSALIISSPTFAETATLSKVLSASVSVSGQMTTDKFSQLMKQGYRSVIVNRPDQEQGNAVSFNQLRELGTKDGIAMIYQPVISGQITRKDVDTFAQHYQQLAKPILMVCRSGSRSSQLFNEAKRLGLINE